MKGRIKDKGQERGGRNQEAGVREFEPETGIAGRKKRCRLPVIGLKFKVQGARC
jgi:hypothetical protein